MTEIIPTGRALGTHHSQRRDRREDALGLKAVLRFAPAVNSGRAPACWSHTAACPLRSAWPWWGGRSFLGAAPQFAAKVAIAARAVTGSRAAGDTSQRSKQRRDSGRLQFISSRSERAGVGRLVRFVSMLSTGVTGGTRSAGGQVSRGNKEEGNLTTGCRRRWAGWEVLGRRVGRSPTAPEPER